MDTNFVIAKKRYYYIIKLSEMLISIPIYQRHKKSKDESHSIVLHQVLLIRKGERARIAPILTRTRDFSPGF